MISKLHLRKIEKIGIVVRKNQKEAISLGEEFTRFFLADGYQILLEDDYPELRQHVKALEKVLPAKNRKVRFVSKTEMVSQCDLILVLGGDGTFISVARLMSKKSVPLIGVNMGQLGFLTEVKKEEAFDVVTYILNQKEIWISERTLLEVTLTRKNKKIFQGPVVNDAVISKGAIARIIGMQISIDGQWVNTVRADGIIVSTPSGSTAYALAAGGPILDPSVPATIIAPICPHSLTQRPLVVPDDVEIQIRLDDRPGHVLLTLDGQDAVDMKEGDIMTIKKFKKHRLKIITSPTRDYYTLLREKLKFGLR